MSETKHTPTPWRITATEGHDCLVGSEYDIIATCDWGDTRAQDIANAAHIVKCVNAHDRLVDALRAISALSNAPTRHVDDYGGDIARSALRDAGIEVIP